MRVIILNGSPKAVSTAWPFSSGCSFDEMRIVWLSKSRIVCEAFVAERIQVLWDGNAVLDDEAGHGTSACLAPDGLHLQVIPLTDIEQGLNNVYFPADALPVEQMLVFFRCEVYQNAVIGLDGFYQHVSQSALPESEHILILAAGQLNMSLHPIGENAVQWAKQAI